MYFTYILFSPSLGVFYTGHTENLPRRMEEHNRGKTAFSAKGMPWQLIFSRSFPTRAEAVALERKIKQRGAARFLKDAGTLKG